MKLFPVTRWILAIIAIFIVWQVVVFFMPRPRIHSYPEKKAILAACQTAANTIERTYMDRNPAGATIQVAVVHFIGDATDAATETMKTTLAGIPHWKPVEGSIVQKFLGDIGRAITEASSVDEIIHAGRRVEIGLVVAGRLDESKLNADGSADATLRVYAFDVQAGDWLLQNTFAGSWKPSVVEHAQTKLLGLSPIARFGIWLAVVILLPLLTAPLTFRITEKKSNLASFVLLLIYTIAGLLLALLLTGFSVIGAGAWMQFFAALAFCAGYNYWICERIAARAAR